MKRTTLTLLAIYFTNLLFAQAPFLIEKGNYLGGGKGRLSFSSQEILDQKYKETRFMVRPGMGVFVADKWAIGANLELETTKIKLEDEEIGKSNEFGAGAWSRYYFLPKTKKTNFFGEAGITYGAIREDDNARIKYRSFNAGLSMAHFINPHIAFELGVDYSSKKYEDEQESINKFGICAGFQMHFNCKKRTKVKIPGTPCF